MIILTPWAMSGGRPYAHSSHNTRDSKAALNVLDAWMRGCLFIYEVVVEYPGGKCIVRRKTK